MPCLCVADNEEFKECPNVDGIYMPCNKWRVSSVIDRLENDLGKPVITVEARGQIGRSSKL